MLVNREAMADPHNEAKLSALFCSGNPVYILIDPLLGEPVCLDQLGAPWSRADLQAAREAAWSRDIHVINLDHSIELPLHLHPYLVQLRDADEWLLDTLTLAQQERLTSQAQGLAGTGIAAHRIGGWLQSPLAGGELARRLSVHFTLDPQPHTQARYLRLADRRVLAWLRHVIGDPRLQWTLGRVDCWAYLDTFGQIAVLTGNEKPIRAHAIWFVNDQWDRLLQGDKYHRAAARWLGELSATDPLPAMEANPFWSAITHALGLAEHVRQQVPEHFITDDDLIAWAVLVLLHPELEQSTDQQPLSDVLASFPNGPLHPCCAAVHTRLLKGSNHEHP